MGVSQRNIIVVAAAALVALLGVFMLEEIWHDETPLSALETPWQEETESEIRFVAADTSLGDGDIMLGLDLKLTKGWKTYWRNSGDSGFAPQFDWSASQNVKDVEIIWPAPQVFEEAGERYYGYKDEVLWPLHVQAVDPSQPAMVALTLNYGVCEAVCVPARAFIKLDVPAGDAEPAKGATLIEAALADVPVSNVTQGIKLSVSLDQIKGSRGELHVTAGEGDNGFAPSFVIVTGAPGTYFSGSKPLHDNGFVVALDHAEPATLRGSFVNLVLLDDEGRAVEGNIAIQ